MRSTPIGFKEASAFIDRTHRHHRRPQGWKWGIGAEKNGRMVGVAMVGLPTSRMLARDPKIIEVRRVATDGTKNACSFLYARCRRIALLMGYERVVTYILAGESGTSLRAAGGKFVEHVRGGTWDRRGRARTDKAPTGPKQRWEAGP